MTVYIKLTVAGTNTGPLFNLYSDADIPPYSVAFATNVPKAVLLAGHTYTVPNGTQHVLITNVGGVCGDVVLDVIALTTTTTTTGI